MAKPKLSDFLVVAIRAIRAKSTKMKRAKPGVFIRRLWNVTSQEYNDEAKFREALSELLKSNVLAATWKLAYGTTRTAEGGSRESSARSMGIYRIESIPENLPFDDDSHYYWHRHDGEFFKYEEREKHDTYEVIRSLLLYVVADGLPKKVPRKNGRMTSAKKTAREIIASMRRSQR